MAGSSPSPRDVVVVCLLLGWQASAQELPRAASTELALPCGAGSRAPRLAEHDAGALLSWVEPGQADQQQLAFTTIEGDAVGPATTVAAGAGWFVNWADTPSVQFTSGLGVAHWLQKSAAGTYDYDVRLSTSADQGRTWSAPFLANRDGVQAEHGFVSIYPEGEARFGAVWLDGRFQQEAPDGRPAGMTLRWGVFDARGEVVHEAELDPLVCDCCPTDVALTTQGPVVVYRDRAAESEVRDIYMVRRVDGAWSEPQAVCADGWVIQGCPVNGPAVAAQGDRVAVAWYTGVGGQPAVQVALSDRGGAAFASPLRLDGGAPLGRVDVLLSAAGDAYVSWLEQVGDLADLRVARVGPGGELRGTWSVASLDGARAGGVPHLARAGGALLVCWTDVAERRVRLLRVTEPGLGLGGAGD